MCDEMTMYLCNRFPSSRPVSKFTDLAYGFDTSVEFPGFTQIYTTKRKSLQIIFHTSLVCRLQLLIDLPAYRLTTPCRYCVLVSTEIGMPPPTHISLKYPVLARELVDTPSSIRSTTHDNFYPVKMSFGDPLPESLYCKSEFRRPPML